MHTRNILFLLIQKYKSIIIDNIYFIEQDISDDLDITIITGTFNASYHDIQNNYFQSVQYIANHNTSVSAVFDLQICKLNTTFFTQLICVEWVNLFSRFITHPNYEIHYLLLKILGLPLSIHSTQYKLFYESNRKIAHFVPLTCALSFGQGFLDSRYRE